MSRKTISIMSNITFAITILLGGYALISIYLVRRSLPPGVCPIDRNRILLYVAIGFALVTFVLSFFDKGRKPRKEELVDQEKSE